MVYIYRKPIGGKDYYYLRASERKGAKVIVDSTIATPHSINPLTLGADIVVHSTTKFLNGKNDYLGGLILTNDAKLLEKIDCLTKLTDLYMDLKLEAARRRTSMAVVMREKITATKTPQKNDVKKIMASLEKLAKENAKYMKNINLTQALIFLNP